MDSNPIHHPSPAKKWNPGFCITLHYWWSARLVDGLEPHPPLLSSQKNKMLIFGLHSTSDDQPGLSMDLYPIHHLPPANKMKCSYFDYVQLLMISQAGWWTRTPSATPLLPKKWNAHFCNTFNFWCWPDLSLDSNPIHHLSAAKKNEMPLFWIMLNFWWLAGLSDGLKPHPPSLSSQKNEMLIFGLHSTFDDWPGWSMDSNPIHHSSPAKKI